MRGSVEGFGCFVGGGWVAKKVGGRMKKKRFELKQTEELKKIRRKKRKKKEKKENRDICQWGCQDVGRARAQWTVISFSLYC